MEPTRLLHGVFILLAVAVYTVYVSRGLSNTLRDQLQSSLLTELDRNPAMKEDYLAFKRQQQDEQEALEKGHQLENRKMEMIKEKEEIKSKMEKLERAIHDLNLA